MESILPYEVSKPVPVYSSVEDSENGAKGGIFNGLGIAWIAENNVLDLFSTSSQQTISTCSFQCPRGQEFQITSVVPVPDETLLIVGLSTETGSGAVALMDYASSRIITGWSVGHRVTKLALVNAPLCSSHYPPQKLLQLLRGYHYVVAVGTEEGHVMLLAFDQRQRRAEGSHYLNLQVVRYLSVDEVYSGQANQKSNAAVIIPLNDTMYVAGKFKFESCSASQDPVSRSLDEVRVTALEYLSETRTLCVGFNFCGAFQLYGLESLDLEFTHFAGVSNKTLEMVLDFTFLEPEDDPRQFCYIAVVAESKTDDTPTACFYSMNYTVKQSQNEGNILYEGLQSITPRLELNLKNIVNYFQDRPLKLISLQSLPSYSSKALDESIKHYLGNGLCCFTLEEESKVHVIIFDLNQWYQAQIPSHWTPGSGSSYIALFTLNNLVSEKHLLGTWIVPDSVNPYRHRGLVSQSEQFFQPAALSFRIQLLQPNEFLTASFYGSQALLLNDLGKQGIRALLHPHEIYTRAVKYGLVSTDGVGLVPSLNQMKESLLTLGLENSCLAFLMSCVKSEGANLNQVEHWAWKQVTRLKDEREQACQILYDHSTLQVDKPLYVQLDHIAKQLTALNLLYETIDSVVRNLNVGVNELLYDKQRTVYVLNLHLQAVIWFLHGGLLPEVSPDDLDVNDVALCFPREELENFYSQRRQDIQKLSASVTPRDVLLIDGMVPDEVQETWKEERSRKIPYPPPSFHALLASYLRPEVDDVTKHRMVQYVFLDLAWLCGKNKEFDNVLQHLVTFPSTFSLRPSLIKVTQAFWHLDHQNFDDALAILLDPLIDLGDISTWQMRCVLRAFLYQGNPAYALKYLTVKQPSCAELEDMQLHLTIFLANNLISEALRFLRGGTNETSRQALMEHFLLACREMRKIHVLVSLPLTNSEEEYLAQFCCKSEELELHEALLMFYLQRSRYAKAVSLNERINKIWPPKNPMLKEKWNRRNSLMQAFRSVLPPIFSQLTSAYGDRSAMPGKEPKNLQPLSTSVRPAVAKTQSASTFFRVAMDKARETWDEEVSKQSIPHTPFRQRKRKVATEDEVLAEKSAEKIPFLSDVVESKKSEEKSSAVFVSTKSAIQDQENQPSKRRKVSTSTPNRSILSTEIASLLCVTPVVKRNLSVTNVSIVSQPSSILKSKRRPVEERGQVADQSAVADAADISKLLRFQLPQIASPPETLQRSNVSAEADEFLSFEEDSEDGVGDAAAKADEVNSRSAVTLSQTAEKVVSTLPIVDTEVSMPRANLEKAITVSSGTVFTDETDKRVPEEEVNATLEEDLEDLLPSETAESVPVTGLDVEMVSFIEEEAEAGAFPTEDKVPAAEESFAADQTAGVSLELLLPGETESRKLLETSTEQIEEVVDRATTESAATAELESSVVEENKEILEETPEHEEETKDDQQEVSDAYYSSSNGSSEIVCLDVSSGSSAGDEHEAEESVYSSEQEDYQLIATETPRTDARDYEEYHEEAEEEEFYEEDAEEAEESKDFEEAESEVDKHEEGAEEAEESKDFEEDAESEVEKHEEDHEEVEEEAEGAVNVPADVSKDADIVREAVASIEEAGDVPEGISEAADIVEEAVASIEEAVDALEDSIKDAEVVEQAVASTEEAVDVLEDSIKDAEMVEEAVASIEEDVDVPEEAAEDEDMEGDDEFVERVEEEEYPDEEEEVKEKERRKTHTQSTQFQRKPLEFPDSSSDSLPEVETVPELKETSTVSITKTSVQSSQFIRKPLEFPDSSSDSLPEAEVEREVRETTIVSVTTTSVQGDVTCSETREERLVGTRRFKLQLSDNEDSDAGDNFQESVVDVPDEEDKMETSSFLSAAEENQDLDNVTREEAVKILDEIHVEEKIAKDTEEQKEFTDDPAEQLETEEKVSEVNDVLEEGIEAEESTADQEGPAKDGSVVVEPSVTEESNEDMQSPVKDAEEESTTKEEEEVVLDENEEESREKMDSQYSDEEKSSEQMQDRQIIQEDRVIEQAEEIENKISVAEPEASTSSAAASEPEEKMDAAETSDVLNTTEAANQTEVVANEAAADDSSNLTEPLQEELTPASVTAEEEVPKTVASLSVILEEPEEADLSHFMEEDSKEVAEEAALIGSSALQISDSQEEVEDNTAEGGSKSSDEEEEPEENVLPSGKNQESSEEGTGKRELKPRKSSRTRRSRVHLPFTSRGREGSVESVVSESGAAETTETTRRTRRHSSAETSTASSEIPKKLSSRRRISSAKSETTILEEAGETAKASTSVRRSRRTSGTVETESASGSPETSGVLRRSRRISESGDTGIAVTAAAEEPGVSEASGPDTVAEEEAVAPRRSRRTSGTVSGVEEAAAKQSAISGASGTDCVAAEEPVVPRRSRRTSETVKAETVTPADEAASVTRRSRRTSEKDVEVSLVSQAESEKPTAGYSSEDMTSDSSKPVDRKKSRGRRAKVILPFSGDSSVLSRRQRKAGSPVSVTSEPPAEAEQPKARTSRKRSQSLTEEPTEAPTMRRRNSVSRETTPESTASRGAPSVTPSPMRRSARLADTKQTSRESSPESVASDSRVTRRASRARRVGRKPTLQPLFEESGSEQESEEEKHSEKEAAEEVSEEEEEQEKTENESIVRRGRGRPRKVSSEALQKADEAPRTPGRTRGAEASTSYDLRTSPSKRKGSSQAESSSLSKKSRLEDADEAGPSKKTRTSSRLKGVRSRRSMRLD